MVFTIKFVGFSGENFPKNQSIETKMGSLDFTKQFMFSSLLQKLGKRNLGQIWGFRPKRRENGDGMMVMVGVTPNCDSSMSKNLFQWFSDAIPGLVMMKSKKRPGYAGDVVARPKNK